MKASKLAWPLSSDVAAANSPRDWRNIANYAHRPEAAVRLALFLFSRDFAIFQILFRFPLLNFPSDVATGKRCTHRFRGLRRCFPDPRLFPLKEQLASLAACFAASNRVTLSNHALQSILLRLRSERFCLESAQHLAWNGLHTQGESFLRHIERFGIVPTSLLGWVPG